MITIFDPRVVAVPTILDAKLCNYYLDTTTSEVVIETISSYLIRILSGYRSPGAPVTILLPKVGYTSLERYTLEEFDNILTYFYVRYYTFIGGLSDIDFIEIKILTKNSIIGDGYLDSEIQLVNDEAVPDADKYYGTGALGTKGYHSFPASHPPVTIGSESSAMGSIDENQVLTLTPIETHPPVTISESSSIYGSIGVNQILTLTPPSGHAPVTIALDSIGILGLSNQELSITLPVIHNEVTIAALSSAYGSIDSNQVLTLVQPTWNALPDKPTLHNPVTIAITSTNYASIDSNQILTIIPTTIAIGSSARASITTGQVLTINPPLRTEIVLAFTDLIDVIPENYIGLNLHVPIVNESLAMLDMIDTEELVTVLARFTLLSDCPSYYPNGTGGYSVVVKQDLSGLEFVNVTSGGTMHNPVSIASGSSTLASIDGSQVLTINASTILGSQEYSAFISQIGTADPTAIVLKNTIGSIVLTRIAVGTYRLTLTGAFTINKTTPKDDIMMDQIGNLYTLTWINTNYLELKTYAYTNISALADGVLNGRYINISIFA